MKKEDQQTLDIPLSKAQYVALERHPCSLRQMETFHAAIRNAQQVPRQAQQPRYSSFLRGKLSFIHSVASRLPFLGPSTIPSLPTTCHMPTEPLSSPS